MLLAQVSSTVQALVHRHPAPKKGERIIGKKPRYRKTNSYLSAKAPILLLTAASTLRSSCLQQPSSRLRLPWRLPFFFSPSPLRSLAGSGQVPDTAGIVSAAVQLERQYIHSQSRVRWLAQSWVQKAGRYIHCPEEGIRHSEVAGTVALHIQVVLGMGHIEDTQAYQEVQHWASHYFR